ASCWHGSYSDTCSVFSFSFFSLSLFLSPIFFCLSLSVPLTLLSLSLLHSLRHLSLSLFLFISLSVFPSLLSVSPVSFFLPMPPCISPLCVCVCVCVCV